jgi:hypothetical protein
VRNHQRGIPTPKKLGQTLGTFAQYMDLIERDPASRCMVCEEPTPPDLLKGVNLKELGIDTMVSGCGNATPLNPASPATANSLIFIANSGNSSDLHFDGDGRDVLLFQGFGRKSVILFPLTHPPSAPHRQLLHRADRAHGRDGTGRLRLVCGWSRACADARRGRFHACVHLAPLRLP